MLAKPTATTNQIAVQTGEPANVSESHFQRLFVDLGEGSESLRGLLTGSLSLAVAGTGQQDSRTGTQ